MASACGSGLYFWQWHCSDSFDACRKEPGKVNSELSVRFDDNYYPAPMEYVCACQTPIKNERHR